VTAPATPPPAGPAGRPAAWEISALIAWMRRLSDAGLHRAGPAELAAFQHAKKNLLTRIEQHNHPAQAPHRQPGDDR
jgi:hypothetical protein